jgi:hypothetical protein
MVSAPWRAPFGLIDLPDSGFAFRPRTSVFSVRRCRIRRGDFGVLSAISRNAVRISPDWFRGDMHCGHAVSVFAAVFSPFRPEFLNFPEQGLGTLNSSEFLIGGSLGAAIVCAGIHFFLAPSKNWAKFLLKALCISVVCGFLGVLGWAVGEQFVNRGGRPVLATRSSARCT